MGRHVKIPKNYGANRIALRRFRDAVQRDRRRDLDWRESVVSAVDETIGLMIEADARMSGASDAAVKLAVGTPQARTSRRGRPAKVRVSYTSDALWLGRLLDAVSRDKRQSTTWRKNVTGHLQTAIVSLHSAELASHHGGAAIKPAEEASEDE